jgi:pimeloyl-ACP methyl ester carboxylesterase
MDVRKIKTAPGLEFDCSLAGSPDGVPVLLLHGFGVSEGRLLLRDLTDHATQPQFIYRHIWRPHDFVIWDNRCTMHRARPFDDKTHRRELRRTTTLDLPLPVSS